jgi:hypothetical protein
MKYRVKELTYKKGFWVEVSAAEPDVSREAWMLMPIGLTESAMLEIAEWVVEHNLGSRQSFNQWRLKNASAMLAFKLKWG